MDALKGKDLENYIYSRVQTLTEINKILEKKKGFVFNSIKNGFPAAEAIRLENRTNGLFKVSEIRPDLFD